MISRNRYKKKVQEKKAQQKLIFSNFTKQEEVNKYLQDQRADKQKRLEKAHEAHKHGVKVLIDLSYERDMDSKEKNSLCMQICICCGWMKKITNPVSLNLVNLNENFEKTLSKMGLKKWPIRAFPCDILEIEEFSQRKTDIIYLSPDAEEELSSIEKDKVYIIGGLVDRTIKKFASLSRAKELNIRTAKLPITKYMGLTRRKPLNIDTVVLLIAEMAEVKDWEKAFLKVCPKRLLLEEEKKEEDDGETNK